MAVEAAQSVRIALGASQSHQSLAIQLSDMGLDVDVAASAQALYDAEPSVVVLDPELLGDLALNQLREKLPRTVFIAADAPAEKRLPASARYRCNPCGEDCLWLSVFVNTLVTET